MNIGVRYLWGKYLTFLFYRSFSCNSTLKIASQSNLNDQLYVNRFFVSSEGAFLSLWKFINNLATILTQLYHECLQIFPCKYMNCR